MIWTGPGSTPPALPPQARRELVCAAAAAAKIENTKTERKILFMLDLTTLELILSDLLY